MVSAKTPRTGARPTRPGQPRRPARQPERPAGPSADLRAIFAALKNVLGRHTRHLQVLFDEPDEYTLTTRKPAPDGKPVVFGSALLRATHVAYELAPMALDPALTAALSPGLRKHLQGKRGFSLTALEPALLEELDLLTRAAMASFTRKGLA